MNDTLHESNTDVEIHGFHQQIIYISLHMIGFQHLRWFTGGYKDEFVSKFWIPKVMTILAVNMRVLNHGNGIGFQIARQSHKEGKVNKETW